MRFLHIKCLRIASTAAFLGCVQPLSPTAMASGTVLWCNSATDNVPVISVVRIPGDLFVHLLFVPVANTQPLSGSHQSSQGYLTLVLGVGSSGSTRASASLVPHMWRGCWIGKLPFFFVLRKRHSDVRHYLKGTVTKGRVCEVPASPPFPSASRAHDRMTSLWCQQSGSRKRGNSYSHNYCLCQVNGLSKFICELVINNSVPKWVSKPID